MTSQKVTKGKQICHQTWTSVADLLPVFLVLAGVSIISRLPFMLDPPLQSDPSMYAYFAYAIARGEIPYRDIVLPHPPIGFMFYSLPVLVFGNNLIVLNLFSISIFALSTVLCYLIARKIFDSRKNCLAVLSALVFALWPGTFVEAFTSPLEVILTFFVLLSFYFYVLYRKSGLFKYTFVSGLFFGISLFVKPTSLFMVIALMFFELVLMIMSKNLRGYLKWFILLLVGGLISSLACLFLITGVFNAFDLFVLQAVKFQTSLQDFLTVSERISYFHWYLVAHIPLLTLSVAGLFPLQKYRFNQMLPAIVAIISMVTEVSLVNTYYHHLYYLTPILSISAIIGAEKLWSSLTSFVKSQNHLKPVTLAMLFIVFVSFVAYADAATKEFNSVFPWWSPNVFSVSNVTATERIVGAIVASMSTPNERIWTSDGSIAFFSGRLIEAPDIQEWPVQVFYIRTWLIYTSALENGSPKKGLLQPSEFVSSWDKHHTRVLVFIRGQGWIPYPDELLWNGYSGLTGVKDYVIENYQLAKVIPHPTSGYTYEVWVSKT